jgi:hypothetical protein
MPASARWPATAADGPTGPTPSRHHALPLQGPPWHTAGQATPGPSLQGQGVKPPQLGWASGALAAGGGMRAGRRGPNPSRGKPRLRMGRMRRLGPGGHPTDRLMSTTPRRWDRAGCMIRTRQVYDRPAQLTYSLITLNIVEQILEID